ncbi:hypothetical protein [Actinomadura madurae]|uniref:hypothetical protein n=1 Tax=Actinomadura madurae TaxID=1993 RepID=UPI0020D20A6B|nr:hypothetical protein [Actinomadura madurae]MCQ0013778.1 hypothetical protein [Actinomadura madurae]
MSAAEFLLGGRADEQVLAVLLDVSVFDEVADDRLGTAVERRQAVPVFGPQTVPDLVLLEADGEELLGDDVTGFRGRLDRFDVTAAPQQRQGGCGQEGVLVEGQEEAVARGARSSARAAEALQERCDRGRGVDLDDAVEVADVDAEFEGAGRDDDAVAGVGERLLGAAALVE